MLGRPSSTDSPDRISNAVAMRSKLEKCESGVYVLQYSDT